MTNLKQLEHAAVRLLTPAFRAGTEVVDFSDYETDVNLGRDIDITPVRDLVEEMQGRFTQEERKEADAWFAPRLHYVFRLTRREAGIAGIWRWMGCVGAPEYVRWRWGKPTEGDSVDTADTSYFVGALYKQAISRAWWMAELFRNGSDYLPVEQAMRNLDIPNYLFRLDVAHHRPTAQAAVRVLEGKGGREANALAKAVNAAATTLPVDVLAPDDPPDVDALNQWVAQAGDADPTRFFDKLPDGPADQPVPTDRVETMQALLAELLEEAPIRGKA